MVDKQTKHTGKAKQVETEMWKKAPPAISHPDYKKLQDKLTEAEAKVNEHWNEVLRAKADLQNVQRRAEQDIAKAHKFALEKFAQDLLPVIDSLERGLTSCDENLTHSNEDSPVLKNIRSGVELTIEMFLKVFQKFGIEQVDPIGHDFNPELHEAMTLKEDPSVKSDTVVEVIQKGYTLNNRLLRSALVVVAKDHLK
jgi:molecular chaperone GrpE